MSKFSVFRKSAGIVLSMTMLFGMSACGKHVEAVITDDSEDITSYQEYPTVETSKADKFSYSDLTVNSLKYMMSENDVRIYMEHQFRSMNLQKKKIMQMPYM